MATNNAYAGPTDINAGTLQVGDGGTTGSLAQGAINNNSVLTFNRSDSVAMTGASPAPVRCDRSALER